VDDGEVMLSGTVSDQAARRLAEDLAAECAGVRDVHNRLRVDDGTGGR
jgi:osmotically-inducible protein OsmY